MPVATSRRRRALDHRLLQGEGRHVGVDALRQVPQRLAVLARGHRHLAPLRHESEQAGDVLAVRPAARAPRHRAGVGQLAHRERALGPQPLEDVLTTGVVGLHPPHQAGLPVLELADAGPRVHLRAVEGEVGTGSQHHLQLDHLARDQQRLELVVGVPLSEPAAEHEVGAGRHDRGDVVLDQGEVVDDLEDVGRPRPGQQLGAHGDPSRLVAGQPVHHRTDPRRPSRQGRVVGAGCLGWLHDRDASVGTPVRR